MKSGRKLFSSGKVFGVRCMTPPRHPANNGDPSSTKADPQRPLTLTEIIGDTDFPVSTLIPGGRLSSTTSQDFRPQPSPPPPPPPPPRPPASPSQDPCRCCVDDFIDDALDTDIETDQRSETNESDYYEDDSTISTKDDILQRQWTRRPPLYISVVGSSVAPTPRPAVTAMSVHVASMPTAKYYGTPVVQARKTWTGGSPTSRARATPLKNESEEIGATPETEMPRPGSLYHTTRDHSDSTGTHVSFPCSEVFVKEGWNSEHLLQPGNDDDISSFSGSLLLRERGSDGVDISFEENNFVVPAHYASLGARITRSYSKTSSFARLLSKNERISTSRIPHENGDMPVDLDEAGVAGTPTVPVDISVLQNTRVDQDSSAESASIEGSTVASTVSHASETPDSRYSTPSFERTDERPRLTMCSF
jgi:hypothetical protein